VFVAGPSGFPAGSAPVSLSSVGWPVVVGVSGKMCQPSGTSSSTATTNVSPTFTSDFDDVSETSFASTFPGSCGAAEQPPVTLGGSVNYVLLSTQRLGSQIW